MLSTSQKILTLLGVLALGVAVPTAIAQDSGPLLDLLVKKGTITDQEAEDLRATLQKDFATNTAAGKLDLSSSLTSLRISGDVRLRYEYRQGQNPAGDNAERDRFRYRLRPAVTGALGSDWIFGFRLENSTNARSSNITFADDGGPYSKTSDTVNVGQVYIGWRPSPDFTVWSGRMPNPLVSTLLVWDGDINPEGFAEQYHRRVGDIDWNLNLGQFLYDAGNKQNSFKPTGNKQDQLMFAWQVVGKYNASATSFVQAAPTIYNYIHATDRAATAGLVNNFGGAFTAANPSGINNLLVFDLPVEFDWSIGSTPTRIFGDYAHNFEAGARATKFGRADLKGQSDAYQLGWQYGKAKLKGEWDAKVYYQATDIFALDPNLVDSDVFDSRVNLQGVVFNLNYQITEAVTTSLNYAHGNRKNKTVGTPSNSPDIGDNADILSKYNLLQLDLVLKF